MVCGDVQGGTEATPAVEDMSTYTYAVGEFVTVESEVEVFLFDVPPGGGTLDPDVVIRRGTGEEVVAERTDGSIQVTVPRSLPTEKAGSSEPVEFTKLLLTAIDRALLGQGATLAFGAVLQTPDGVGVGLFGDSGCGKSTAAFRLARDRGYRLLADDLLVCHGDEIRSFPRYVNLPRDVPSVETWLRSTAPRTDRIRRWNDELDVPRALVSEVVPERVELDYAVLVDPPGSRGRAASSAPTPISTERAVADVAAWNGTNLDGWTTHPAIPGPSGGAGPGREGAIRAVFAGADCYRIAARGGPLSRSIAGLVRRGRRFGTPPA